MVNKEWSYGTHNGLDRRLKLVGYTFIEEDQPNPMITVFLREQLLSPTGEVVSDKAADYSVIKDKISYDIDSLPLPKRNTLGEVQYQLDEEGNVTDTAGYHKALYSAMNADKIAQHFYEQGKADAVKEVISSPKNPSGPQPRQAPSDVFINGLRVKSVSGYDSSKLRIKTKKFN